MKVSTLKSRTRRIWIEVPGEEGQPNEKIWVDYFPGNLTLEISEKVNEAILTGVETEVLFVMLTNLLAGWDLQVDVLDENGVETGEVRQLGVTADDIKVIPLTFLGAIMGEIESDSRPNPERDVTLDAGLLQTEQSVTSLNGISSSEQQTDSTVPLGSFSSNQ